MAKALTADVLERDYEALRGIAEQHGLGYRQAAKRAGVPVKRARRLWEQGVPQSALSPLRDRLHRRADTPQQAGRIGNGKDIAPPPAVALVDTATPEALKVATATVEAEAVTADTINVAVEQTVHRVSAAAKQAQAAAITTAAESFEQELEALANEYAAHEHRILKDRVSGMPIEAGIVKQTRGAAAYLLSHTVKLLRASEPVLDKMREELQHGDFDLAQGLTIMAHLTRFAHRVVDLGDKAMQLQRRLVGQPESVLGVHHEGTVEIAPEEAAENINHLLNAVEHVNVELAVVEGGEAVQAV